jgi:hypothetical protein
MAWNKAAAGQACNARGKWALQSLLKSYKDFFIFIS